MNPGRTRGNDEPERKLTWAIPMGPDGSQSDYDPKCELTWTLLMKVGVLALKHGRDLGCIVCIGVNPGRTGGGY